MQKLNWGNRFKNLTFEANLKLKFLKNTFSIVLILSILASCNSTKHVANHELLLTKNTIMVNEKKMLDDEITGYIVQKPNQTVVGIPIPLHFYNIGNKNFIADFELWKKQNQKKFKFLKKVFSEKQVRGIRNFKKTLNDYWFNNGEAPVIFDQEKANATLNSLKEHYFQEGYFKTTTWFTKKKAKNKKIEITYHVNTDTIFTINKYNATIKSKLLDSIYQKNKAKSFIIEGNPIKYSSFLKEQNRLTKLFRNSGIYRFNKNAITFDADTSHVKHSGNYNLIIEDSIANQPYKIQKISAVNVYTNFKYENSLKKDSLPEIKKNYKNINFIAKNKVRYNPKWLYKSIFIQPNQIYKDSDREFTGKSLRGLKNFKSVSIFYNEKKDNSLEANILLTPLKKYKLVFDTELTHSNIKRLGILGKISFLNRNTFKGAEILKFSVQGSFLDSKDAAKNNSLLNAWEIGTDVSLEIPRFLLPFNTKKFASNKEFPKTTLSLGTSLQKNIGLDKQKFTGIFGYSWERKNTTHKIELINLQLIKNLNIGSYFSIYKSEFDKINEIAQVYFNQKITPKNTLKFINNNITSNFEKQAPEAYNITQNIKRRHQIITEDAVVPSATYTYTYNNSESYKDTDFSFFKARIVASGNLTSLLSKQTNQNKTKTLFNSPIAQYAKLDLEFKRFWNISNQNILAFRNFLGIAIPYKNSENIPFTRSYFIGGSNDLRAWRIYDLGPGTSKSGLEYNVGNLKFLTSLEYRFKILNSLKGALFIDAGNIWDISKSKLTTKEEKFNGLKSLKDLAVGSGFGVRYDLSFILIRVDLGFKTHEPYLPKGKKWFKHYNFSNAVFNFGISYPF